MVLEDPIGLFHAGHGHPLLLGSNAKSSAAGNLGGQSQPFLDFNVSVGV